MEKKDAIFADRKAMKQKSHAIVRGHYLLLILLTLILVRMGVEFSYSKVGTGFEILALFMQNDTGGEETAAPGNMLSDEDLLINAEETYSAIQERTGKENGLDRMVQFVGSLVGKEQAKKIFGRTKGVLAGLVNNLSSGRLIPKMIQGLLSVYKSDSLIEVISILLSLVFYILVFTFIKNVYSASIRRILLEAGTYESVSYMDIFYFGSIRRWVHASWVLLVKSAYESLWSLTIIGGVIKWYAYWAVPYIMAENPDMPANEAVTFSRKMMYGHKWELFKYQMTLAGWVLLSIVTFGISDALYGVSYRMACYTEFYTRIRQAAFENELEGIEWLNDTYLYEKADRILLYEAYFEVVDEITVLHENRMVLTGWRKWVAEWLGIWIGSLTKKKAYDEQEGKLFAIEGCKKSMDQKAYPMRLSPLIRKGHGDKLVAISYLRCYTVWSLILMFLIFSFVGWSWEVILHFIQVGQLVNRGTLHGPWLPIYGLGGIIALVLCARFRKKPVVFFLVSTTLCGVIEYVSSWTLEMKYHQKWWSYDGYFLNINGRICAEGLLVFGIGCCVVVYVLAPMIDHMLSKLKPKVLIALSLILGGIYVADLVYSGPHPNMVEGAIEAETEAVTEKNGGTVPLLTGEAATEAGTGVKVTTRTEPAG